MPILGSDSIYKAMTIFVTGSIGWTSRMSAHWDTDSQNQQSDWVSLVVQGTTFRLIFTAPIISQVQTGTEQAMLTALMCSRLEKPFSSIFS